MLDTNVAIASPDATEMSDFDREMAGIDEYVHQYLSKQGPEPECSNHADELTYEAFAEAADGLSDAFGVAVAGYYAR